MASFALVSDFDGTITRNDFYTLIAERYMGPDAMNVWDSYRAGKITHFEAMQWFFSHAPDDEDSLESLLRDVAPDPSLSECAEALSRAGWDLIIVSAGSSWYIDTILQRCRVQATVHSNPGRIIPGRGLVMDLPRNSPYFCPDVGIDKSAVMQSALGRYQRVAFAGDGPPDIAPSLIAYPDLRFARGFLADELLRRREPFRRFERWCDVVHALLRDVSDSGGNTVTRNRIPLGGAL